MDIQQEEQIEKAIPQALDGYFVFASQCDQRKFMSVFVDSDEMTVIENEEIHPSRKAFKEWITEFYKGIVKLDAAAEERRVFPLSPDGAVTAGVFRCSTQTTSGEMVVGRNAFTFVFVDPQGYPFPSDAEIRFRKAFTQSWIELYGEVRT